jgi:galactokinase
VISRAVPHTQRVEELVAAFERQFGRPPEGIAEAPGRVNLIGEHVDYNDGLVLPFAIDRSVMCAWGSTPESWRLPEELAKRELEAIKRTFGLPPDFEPGQVEAVDVHSVENGAGVELVVSMDRDANGAFLPALDENDVTVLHTWAPDGSSWSMHPEAVVKVMRHLDGFEGTDILTQGNVPQGAGLSSSAALELGIAGALRDVASLPIDDVELARLCQRAENEYVGVQCGIMDQFASALSKRGHALLIDCRTLAYEHVPLRLAEAGLCVVVVNSGVKRELASSAYNDRRRECGEAVAVLRERLRRAEMASLRDVTQAEIDAVALDTGPLRRARHVVSEIGRVAAAVEALRRDDFVELGRLMGESHRSLREDYEVSSPELDLLVALATAQEYVLGARLTGAGFGGCTVNVVRADGVDAFERDVVRVYRERTGSAAEMYVVEVSDGLRTWRV